MGRLLTLIVLVVLAVWLVRRALRRAAPPPEVRTSQTSDELVRCVQCGVLLPRAEARMAAGVLYCSDEHARLGPTGGPGKR
jgi:uncharacterized protein